MTTPATAHPAANHFRFHMRHMHLGSVFGDGWFGDKAEAFARFFGTPVYLLMQSLAVLVWVALNSAGIFTFDLYPFILLNLMFSLQAAYAAPMILLAQTRQADRDKAHADADALHREALAEAAAARQEAVFCQSATLLELMEMNTRLTETVRGLSERIHSLTVEVHQRTAIPAIAPSAPIH